MGGQGDCSAVELVVDFYPARDEDEHKGTILALAGNHIAGRKTAGAEQVGQFIEPVFLESRK